MRLEVIKVDIVALELVERIPGHDLGDAVLASNNITALPLPLPFSRVEGAELPLPCPGCLPMKHCQQSHQVSLGHLAVKDTNSLLAHQGFVWHTGIVNLGQGVIGWHLFGGNTRGQEACQGESRKLECFHVDDSSSLARRETGSLPLKNGSYTLDWTPPRLKIRDGHLFVCPPPTPGPPKGIRSSVTTRCISK